MISDEFPLMVDVWEEMFGIEIEEGPQIGLVDLSEVHFKYSRNRIREISRIGVLGGWGGSA